MHLQVVGPEHVKRERPLKLRQGQRRRRLRIRIALLANVRKRRARQLVDAPHERSHQPLDVPAIPRRAHRTVIEIERHADGSHAPGRANETPCRCRRARSAAGPQPATASGFLAAPATPSWAALHARESSATEVAHGGSSDIRNPATMRESTSSASVSHGRPIG